MSKKQNNKRINLIPSTFIISLSLCIISVGLLIATCLFSYYNYTQNAKMMKEIDSRVSQSLKNNSYNAKNNLEDIYLTYYNSIDEKASSTINIALSFFGCVFSLTTIVNTIIAVRLPKQFEKSLEAIDDRVIEIEKSAQESKNSARYVDKVISTTTIRERIDSISEIIDEYGDNSGEFYFARGFLYDDIKDYERAKADFIRAKKAGGKKHTYHNSLGVLYSHIMIETKTEFDIKKAFEKAEYNYKKAIILLEENELKSNYCHCNLACLYQDYAKLLKSRFKPSSNNNKVYEQYIHKALKEYDEAIKICEDNLTAYLNRGISYKEMGEDYYINAYDDFKKCRQIDPDNKHALKQLFNISTLLYTKNKEEEYYFTANSCIKKLCETTDELENLKKKFDAITSGRNNTSINVDGLVAKIDEKIADLSVDMAKDYEETTSQYVDLIDEAINNYKSALNYYGKLPYNENKEDIERINYKLSKIQKD